VKPRPLALLILSGLGDALGGFWALLDWRAPRLLARTLPDWEAQQRAPPGSASPTTRCTSCGRTWGPR
jgi:hypothetical protein